MDILKNAKDKAGKKAMGMINAAKEAAKKREEEDRKRREEKEREFKESFPHKYMLSATKNTVFHSKKADWAKGMKYEFVISNIDDKPVFVVKEGFFSGEFLVDTYKYILINQQKEKVGSVRKHFFNFGFPFVKQRRGCTVKIDSTKEKFRLTTYMSWWKEREYGGTGTITGEGVYELGGDKLEDAKKFKIKKSRKNIIHIYKGAPSDGFLIERYIAGYDNEADENLAALCTLAVYILME